MEQKYKSLLDPKFKLPKLCYKGNSSEIPYQIIRKRKAPIIQEVAPAYKSKGGGKRGKIEVSLRCSLMYWDCVGGTGVVCAKGVGKPVEEIEEVKYDVGGFFELSSDVDLVENIDDVKCMIDVAPEFMMIHIVGVYKKVEIFLPQAVNVDKVRAAFDHVTKQVKVTMPLCMYPCEWVNRTTPDIGSRPWLLSNAIQRDETLEPTQQKEEEKVVEFPEDRFHLDDLLSQHIKTEREQQRAEKEKEHAAKEAVRKAKEEKEAKEACEEAKLKLLEQARGMVTNGEPEEEEEELDLF